MEKKIEFDNLHGDENAKKLFIVTNIDEDDAEDTTSSMWLANDEDHLFDLVKEEYVGESDEDDDEDDEDDPVAEAFDNDWGFTILYKEVGTVK
jgi:hypothetical protein